MFKYTEAELKQRIGRLEGLPRDAATEEKIAQLDAQLIALKNIDLFMNLKKLFGFETETPETASSLRRIEISKRNVAVRYRHQLPTPKNFFLIVLDIENNNISFLLDSSHSTAWSLEDPKSIDNLIAELIATLMADAACRVALECYEEYCAQHGHDAAIELLGREVKKAGEYLADALSGYRTISALNRANQKEKENGEDHRTD